MPENSRFWGAVHKKGAVRPGYALAVLSYFCRTVFTVDRSTPGEKTALIYSLSVCLMDVMTASFRFRFHLSTSAPLTSWVDVRKITRQ